MMAGVTGSGANDCYVSRVWIKNCATGWDVQSSSGHHISLSYFTDNTVYGVYLATDSVIIDSFVGNNGSGAAWNACNVFVEGWDGRLANCHIWGTGVTALASGIYGHYANDVTVVGCKIEEHSKNGIHFNGRANGWTIIGNYFEDNSYVTHNLYDAIDFDIAVGEKGENNVITGNRFGQQSAGVPSSQRYCVAESARCNWNLIANNMMRDGYLTAPALVVGGNTAVRDNMLGEYMSEFYPHDASRAQGAQTVAADSSLGEHNGGTMVDAAKRSSTYAGVFRAAPSSVKVVVIPSGTGNMAWYCTSDFAAVGEAYNANSDALGSDGTPQTTAAVTNQMAEIESRMHGFSVDFLNLVERDFISRQG